MTLLGSKIFLNIRPVSVTFRIFSGHNFKKQQKLGQHFTNIHQELIERCRRNDKKAQFEIYQILYKPMYNTSLRILNNTAEAEDIMQEAFLDAFGKIGHYRGEGSFAGWLRKIVVNHSIDALKKRRQEIPFENLNFDIADSNNVDEDTTVYQVEEIKKAMMRLPEEHRVIISLFLFEGYDHEEISEILNISNNASRTRYSRARQKLLQFLCEQRKIGIIHPN
jgi:RNA polymerase sigma-70 factor (ECF subfamily)